MTARKIPCAASRWHAHHTEGEPCPECPAPAQPVVPVSISCAVEGPEQDEETQPFDFGPLWWMYP